MDSLTQIVLGAAVAQQFVGRPLGNRALLYGAILGTIPDLDVFVGKYFDLLTANEIHRGFSHSILFALLATPPLGWLMMKIERRAEWNPYDAYYAVFGCLITHSLLDAFTTWGTQLLWPLDYKIAIQSIFVVDPLYTLPFLVCMCAVAMCRVYERQREKWNKRGLIISSTYLALTVVLQFFAKQKFEASLYKNNLTYEEVSVRPAPLNSILWNANIRNKDYYLLADYSFFDTSPVEFRKFQRNEKLLGSHINDDVIKRLIRLSEGWYTISQDKDRLHFNDLRFGLLDDSYSDPEFVFRYELRVVEGHMQAFEAQSEARKYPATHIVKVLKRMLGR